MMISQPPGASSSDPGWPGSSRLPGPSSPTFASSTRATAISSRSSTTSSRSGSPASTRCSRSTSTRSASGGGVGPRLALWGTVGRQTTFAFGRPHEIREEVRTRIETLGRAGLVLCPAYDIDEPDVPSANAVAFLEAGRAFGYVSCGGDLARRSEPQPLPPTAARGPCASQCPPGGLTRPLAFIVEGDAAMSDNRKVQWTNGTWHPVMGCSKVPQDCCCASYGAETASPGLTRRHVERLHASGVC
jgi:hypothetical protein